LWPKIADETFSPAADPAGDRGRLACHHHASANGFAVAESVTVDIGGRFVTDDFIMVKNLPPTG
jgi:hypothetical protein